MSAEYITQAAVIDLGFTKSMIKTLLPEPTLKTNPIYKCAAPMRLHRVADVNAAMETEAYKVMIAKADARRASALKAVDTKRRNGEMLVAAIVASLD